MHTLLRALAAFRAPLGIALLAALVIIVPGQSREVFLMVSEATGSELLWQSVRVAAWLLLFSLALLAVGITIVERPGRIRTDALSHHRVAMESLALSLPLVPLLSLVVAMVDGRTLFGGLVPKAVNAKLVVVACALAVLVLIYLSLVLWGGLRTVLWRASTWLVAPIGRIGAMPGLLVTALAIGVVVACVTLLPKQVADLLGPVGVLLLFFSLLLVMATLLTYGYDQHQIPSIPVLLLIAMLCGTLGSNNNHTLRLANAGVSEPGEVSSAFQIWLQQRPDLVEYGDRPYPVYVVTAEGGGLYAAAHAAFTLARVQDNCAAFASHVFAISSVSGGSLGSALFASLLKAHPPERKLDPSRRCQRKIAQNDGTLQKAVFAYFQEDLLTPLLAAALFPDFLQRFLPVRVEAFDRARALELSFEDTWAKTMRAAGLPDLARVFAGDSRAVWAAGADVPALLLNTTIVQSGDRAVIAPFRLESAYFRDLVIDLLNGTSAPTLSAAVSASARFPYILPPALYVNPENSEAYQMIDGGYYENTGIQTAINLIDLLRGAYPPASVGAAGAPPPETCVRSNAATVNLKSGPVAVCFKIISIRARNGSPWGSAIDESVTPIVGVYQARQAVGRDGKQELIDRFCGGIGCGYGSRAVQPHVYVQRLDTSRFSLAWSFSDTTLKALQKSDPEPVACWVGDGPRATATADQANTPPDRIESEENVCLQRRVALDLATR